jgi:hypothetical protein
MFFYYKSFIGFLFNLTISILVVYVGHYLWNYIKDTYSTKKTKDLVNTQIEKYKKMMKQIQENNTGIKEDFLNETEKNTMDKELVDFMMKIEEPFQNENQINKENNIEIILQ